MKDLHFKDISNLAGFLTGCRLLIAVTYPLLAVDWQWALGLLVVGSVSDMLDGWVARKQGMTSHTGAFADGWVDKIFGINVTWTLVLMGYLEWWMGIFLFSREWIQIPLVPYYVTRYMRGILPKNTPFWAGKVASFSLFWASVFGILNLPIHAFICTMVTGILGLWTALIYFQREFEIP